MGWHKPAIGWAALLAAGYAALASSASAQTFNSYRCSDGTNFILAFYPSDKRAYLQIDGRAVTLKKSLAVSGGRYLGGGVSLTVTATGARIKHLRRPATACERS
jgi:membrane-bound inhibitor of C-type lysozyme